MRAPVEYPDGDRRELVKCDGCGVELRGGSLRLRDVVPALMAQAWEVQAYAGGQLELCPRCYVSSIGDDGEQLVELTSGALHAVTHRRAS